MEKILKPKAGLKAKLPAAQSAEKAAALVKADGQELTLRDAAQLLKEIQKGREHYSNSPISITCPKCGTYFYKYEQRSTSNPFAKIPVYYICKTCGYREFAYYLD